MRRNLALGILATTLFVAACQDSDDASTPTDIGLPTLAVTPALSPQQQAERVVPGRILARLVDGADPATVGNAHGVAFDRMVAGGTLAIFNGTAGNERALAARLGGDAQVVYAEPDYLRQTTEIDTRMWAFYNPGGLFVKGTRGRNKGRAITSYLSLDDADEDNIEGYASTGSPVSIASIDTGVQMNHPEFLGMTSATIEPGWDYIGDDPDPSDENDHGTHTTGTMVGNTVGVAGVSGAAHNVTVYVYRVCGPAGCPTSAIVAAIRAATLKGVVAMNLSLGGSSISESEEDAIRDATAAGSLVIASAGNGGTGTVSCPACDPNAISVAASDWLDEHAYYTNWGPGLDITAPGGELYSNTTSEAGIYSSVRGNGYAYFQGTSMAAPQVTGTAAIVASVTGLRGFDLRARLLGTTDDLGAAGYDEQFGYGRLNSYRAVKDADLGDGPPATEPDPLTASFSVSCNGLSCTFDGSGSTGNIISYAWTFGGSSTDFGVTVNHTYGGAGTYPFTLTVDDGTGTANAAGTVSCTLRGKKVRCK